MKKKAKKNNSNKISKIHTGVLVLENRTVLKGIGIGYEGTATGEVCFNTSLTGYQEIISDPSYAGQIINFTFPHIGNVGTNKEDHESDKIWTKGVILNSEITNPSNYRSLANLDLWLKRNKVVGITGLDTRSLTNFIRDKGAPKGTIALNKKGKFNFEIDEEPLKFNKDKISLLKPAFSNDGTITAANASSLSDGAAALLIGNDNLSRESQIQPKAKIISHASFSTEPIYFTKAPIYAIQNLLKQSNLSISDIDIFEINEAFSCVPMVALEKLNIPKEKLNVNGGAVSMGHPIGASGARILVTLVNALIKRKLKYGIASICIGGGEACAILIEK